MPRTRSDIHRDAMLRHLGAAYYESLHGRATRADVARALETIEEHLHEEAQRGASGESASAQRGQQEHATGQHPVGRHPHGWARRVRDLMTASVVTVDRITPYKEIARLLAEHRVSGLPVLKMGRQVVGVVTEADLLAAQADTARRLRSGTRRAWWRREQQHPALTAGDLMTSPAITIGPDATVPAAARLMSTHHVRRLPVVNPDGRLVGIVSRRDLLSVFLRPDEEIAADIRRVLDDFLLVEPEEADAKVHNGVVTLTGTLKPAVGQRADLIPVAIRLMWDVDGVVDIVDRLGEARPSSTADQALANSSRQECSTSAPAQAMLGGQSAAPPGTLRHVSAAVTAAAS
ncbi:MAG TPA: CBS domain-containing protein [Trebonia sp.]|jgi:CBS domain-containing protein